VNNHKETIRHTVGGPRNAPRWSKQQKLATRLPRPNGKCTTQSKIALVNWVTAPGDRALARSK